MVLTPFLAAGRSGFRSGGPNSASRRTRAGKPSALGCIVAGFPASCRAACWGFCFWNRRRHRHSLYRIVERRANLGQPFGARSTGARAAARVPDRRRRHHAKGRSRSGRGVVAGCPRPRVAERRRTLHCCFPGFIRCRAIGADRRRVDSCRGSPAGPSGGRHRPGGETGSRRTGGDAGTAGGAGQAAHRAADPPHQS
jgi:hypothetical protein